MDCPWNSMSRFLRHGKPKTRSWNGARLRKKFIPLFRLVPSYLAPPTLPRLITLFGGPQGLPAPTLFRFWDSLFSEGIKVLFRCALVLLRRSNLHPLEDAGSLENSHRKIKLALAERTFDHNEFMKEMFRIRKFSREEVHTIRQKNYKNTK